MTAINRLLLTRKLAIPGLNFLVKRHKLADWIRKQDQGWQDDSAVKEACLTPEGKNLFPTHSSLAPTDVLWHVFAHTKTHIHTHMHKQINRQM